jgi:transcriptional regulator of acetoin/glycerol metabolism
VQPGEISTDVLDLFKSHPWPGNIRQMVSVIQISLAMAEPEAIQMEHLPDDFLSDSQIPALENSNIRPFIAPENAENNAENNKDDENDKDNWLEAYERMNRNISKTAKELNISRNTLYKRLRESGLK